jgi:hypothetical protein
LQSASLQKKETGNEKQRYQGTCVYAGLAALLVTVAVAGKDRFSGSGNGIAFSEFREYDACAIGS